MSVFSYFRGRLGQGLIVGTLVLLSNWDSVQAQLRLSDIGSPSASSTAVTDLSGTTLTTTARGLGAVSSNDEVAFYHHELRSTGTLEWTQQTLASGQAGRCDGLMIRRSLEDDAAMVYFGYQNDGTGTPTVVLSWRSVDGGSLSSKIINDTPLRDSMGVLRLSLEWIRGKVVVKYFADSTDTWAPLYALDMEADESGEVLGGFARASGTSAASWGALLSTDGEAVEAGFASAWSKVAEPLLANIAERATTIGVGSHSAVPSPTATAPARHWTVVSQASFSGGDYFSCPVSLTEAASVYLTSLSSPTTANEDVDVFVRWGTPSSGTAAVDVDISILEGSTEVASRVVNQNSEAGLWVYAGTAPAETAGHNLTVKLDVPVQAAATFSIDGALLLSRGDDADSDGDGLPDEWENSFTYAGYAPQYDDDGDGINNIDEYEQGLDPWGGPSLYAGFPEIAPVLISTDPSEASLERRAPLNHVRSKPLQYKVTYYGTTTPVHGFRFIFTPLANLNSVALGRSFDGSFATGDMTTHTDAQGLATSYVKFLQSESDFPISGPLVSSGDEFLIDSYVNHPPGPVDAIAEKYTLTKIHEIPHGGQVVVSGPWLAVCDNDVVPEHYGIVQLYQWESQTNSWRATHSITAPTDASSTSGFGDLVALSGSTLAVYASGLDKVFVFELKENTQYWELKATLTTTSATADSIALAGDRLVLGVTSEDRAYAFSKNSTTWTADTPAYVEADSGDVSNLEFGSSTGLSLDGATLWVGAPQASGTPSTVHGEVSLYTRSGSGWSMAQTLTSTSGGQTGRFGCSAVLVEDMIVIGAPSRSISSGIGRIWYSKKSSGVWQTPQYREGTSSIFGLRVWADSERVLVTDLTWPSAAFRSVWVFNIGTLGLSQGQRVMEIGDFGAYDDGSLFIARPSAVGIVEYKNLPTVPYNESANALVATLDYNDADEDIHRVSVSQPWDLWSLEGTALDELKVSSTADLLAHGGTLQWISVELEDLAASRYNETLTIRISGIHPAVPENLTASISSGGVPLLTWEHDLSPLVTIHVERAELEPYAEPTGEEYFQVVSVVEGTALHATDAYGPTSGDFVYRIFALNSEGPSGYSNMAVIRYDMDYDGLPDWWEEAFGYLEPSSDDDGDGVTNLYEYGNGTNPLLADTDGDGSPDNLDSVPYSRMSNPLHLRVFTKLRNY